MNIYFAAEDVLAQLNDQLTRRKAQLQDAADKLAQIQQAIHDQVKGLLQQLVTTFNKYKMNGTL